MSLGEFERMADLARLRKKSSPSKPGIAPGSPATMLLAEGDYIEAKASDMSTGTVEVRNAAGGLVKTISFGPKATFNIGPYRGTNSVSFIATAGSIDATVGDAVLGVVKPALGAGGVVTGLRDGAGKLIKALRNSFLSRPVGGPILNAAQGTQNSTGLLAWQSPVPFYAVRVTYFHLGGIGDVAGFKSIMAVTDDVGTRDFTDITAAAFKKVCTPKRGGVTYNAIVTDDSPGWRDMYWGPSSINPLAIPNPGTDPISTIGNLTGVSTGIMPMQSTLDVANNFYPLLMRYVNGTGAVTFVNNLTGQQVSNNVKTDFPSLMFMNLSRGGDSVTTPSGWTDANGPNNSGSAPNITIEFFTTSKVISVEMSGDSRLGVASDEMASNKYRSAENYLHNAFAALGVAASIVRHGISGAATAVYQKYTMADYSLETPSDWLVHIMFSRNPTASNLETPATIGAALALTAQIVEQARKKGQKVLLIPAFPTGLSGSPSYSAPQLALLKSLVPYANQAADILFDGLSIYGDASGAWLPGVAYDAPHMNDVTTRDFTNRIAQLIVNYENGL